MGKKSSVFLCKLCYIDRNSYSSIQTRLLNSLFRFDEHRLTLRIHRGRNSIHNGNGNSRSPDSSGRNSVKREKIKISVSYPSTETLDTKCNTLERTPSRCSQISVHYSNGQSQTQLCSPSRNAYLKVELTITIETLTIISVYTSTQYNYFDN